ncbi:DUF7701 domain-containing protein [Nocardiopsis sp. A1-1-1]|uniref:DUF7701 domain-containing protein n=1 Tax=Nocardiopsis TaxID=2013 RepID=UPI003B9C8B58
MYLNFLARKIRSNISSEDLVPDDSDELFLLYALLARSVGSGVTAENVHDAWSIWMSSRDPSHPSLVPFSDLPAEKQKYDLPYLNAIKVSIED